MTNRQLHPGVSLIPVVALVCCLGAAGGVLGASQSPYSSSTASGRVVGTLVDTAGIHRVGVEIFLHKAVVLERDSKGDFHHAVKLPAKQPFIVGTPTEDQPVATQTDSKGGFEFNAVPPGRYTIGVKRKDTPRSGESEYDSLYHGEAIVVFDLTPSQILEAGRVFQKAR